MSEPVIQTIPPLPQIPATVSHPRADGQYKRVIANIYSLDRL